MSGQSEKGSHLIALTAAIVCGIFLREVGLALVISSTALLFIRKNYKTALLILGVSLGVFALWYIRNEVLVAGIEHPPLRNSQLFFRHLFTPSTDSILNEFGARLRTNAENYGINVLQLPLLAETILRGISTMAPSQFPIVLVLGVMPYVYHFMLIITAVVVVVGSYIESRKRLRSLILAGFLGIYLIPILLYPINDVRFLFPPLIIILYLFVIGLETIVQKFMVLLKRPERTSVLSVVFLAIFALPNTSWLITYVGNSWRYARSPLGFFDSMRSVKAYPELFARPLHLAGTWLSEHTDSSAVIISRWKELGVYTEGRKVLDVDPQTLIDPFEDMLRDYDVHYIVTVVARGGLREYEQLFAQSDHFRFQTAARFADLEIIKVESGPPDIRIDLTDRDSSDEGIQRRFAGAIKLLEENKPAECEAMLTALPEQARKQIPAIFNIAVAKEFAGNLTVANTMFEQFHKFQQAGSVIQPAWYHLEIISKLNEALKAHAGTERAMDFQAVGAYYWILGFHTQSLMMMDSSIEADSTFFPSLIFRAIYSLLDGDTLKANRFLERSRKIDPTNTLVVALSKVFENLNTLRHSHDQTTDFALRFDNARQFSTMGLRENAIDGLLELHSRYPKNAECLQSIVKLYQQKERYAPALVYLKKLLALRPDDSELQIELQQLEQRW